MMKIFAGVTVSRVSYSIMLICALEFMFWFAPVLSTSSAVSVTQMERAGALAYYQAAAQFGATDAPMVAHAQRELLAVNAAEAQRSVLASARDEWAAGAAANSGGALNGAAAMLGSLVLTGGALLLGGGGGGVGGGGGGGRGGRRIAQCADGSGADANNNNNNGKKKKKQQQPAAATSGDDGMAAASMGGALPLVAAATVGAAAALAMRTGSAGGAGGVARRFASKASGASRAPAAAMDAQVRSQQQQQQQQQQPASKQQASKQQAAMPFEVVPPHALKADCGQAVEAPPAALSSDALRAKSDAELVALIDAGALAPHTLETALGDLERAVRVRRAAVAGAAGASLDALPFEHYDYSKVVGACAENVLGYVPIPVGVAGPVLMDGRRVALPMATTEGCLIASTHRGCKAISESGGATTVLTNDGMTRAPAVQLPSAARAGALMAWLGDAGNEQLLRDAFESTTRFGKLLDVRATMAGRLVYVRFRAQTGDAMGMNMISKGVEAAMAALTAAFPDADCVALSGNMCTDKKPSAINWVNGRGKSVVAEAVVRADVVRRTLKSDVDALVALNVSKNLVGSAMAGSVGGFNAHASNIVTALYLATGQDPAQNVESSNCITLMERTDDGDLRISVTMPSIECAAIGGGTHLPAQHAALELMGCAGAHADTPGANAQQFARAVAVGTLAGELSLMSALCAGHLVRAHMAHNRKK